MATAEATTEVTLELSAEEAVTLCRLLAYHVGGSGRHRRILDDIEQALQGVTTPEGGFLPKYKGRQYGSQPGECVYIGEGD